jgi:hypothetical protein
MIMSKLGSTRFLYKLSLNVFTLFSIRASSVMSPCFVQSLSMLVTTLGGTRGLYKLSLDV